MIEFGIYYLIPELVWRYSRTRLSLFPNSFPLFPNSFGLIPEPELVWPYSRTRRPESSRGQMSSGIRQTSSGITWAEKIDPKLDHFLDASWNRSLDGLCWILVPKSILGWLCLPTRHQTSNKIVKRSMPRCIPSWTPFVECFLVGVCFQHRPIGSQKTCFSYEKNKVFWNMAFRC